MNCSQSTAVHFRASWLRSGFAGRRVNTNVNRRNRLMLEFACNPNRRLLRVWPVVWALLVWALLVCCQPAVAQVTITDPDTVILMLGERTQARTRLTGEVLDYTGKNLRIKLSTGTERVFPADRVVEIQTVRSVEHLRGRELNEQGDLAGALLTLEKAARSEQRRWVRREILAEIVTCQNALGDAAAAGSYFLLLVGDDPETPYFDRIPLNWENRQVDPSLESRATGWLNQADNPVAVLLGTSHLISGQHRSAALLKLSSLKFNSDARIAGLARAQSWRTELVTVTASNAEQWNLTVRGMPESVRAGGYFMLGQAYARLDQPENAALSLLRVPILYQQQPSLARRCLMDAGRQFQRIGQISEAAGLYREAIEQYPRVAPRPKLNNCWTLLR